MHWRLASYNVLKNVGVGIASGCFDSSADDEQVTEEKVIDVLFLNDPMS